MSLRHGPAHLVFISHSTKDRWIARQMAAIIESQGRRYGIVTFLDERDIQGGDSIPETILTKLRECQEFVILLSPQSIARQWVLVELGAALGLQKHIVPIIHNVAPTDIPDIIRLTKAHELNDFEHYLDELVRRVRGTGKK
jgi:hypothetical protein